MYVINLVISMTWKHRSSIENRIREEKSPLIRKRLKNLLLGKSAKKIAQTPCIDIKTIQDLIKKYKLQPHDKLQIIQTIEGEQKLNKKTTLKDLIPQLKHPWL